MAITIDPNTGETVQGGKSPRFVLWLTFFAFATIVMGSAISEQKKENESSSNARWAVFCSSFSFATAGVVTLMHLTPSLSHYVVGTKVEGVLTLVLVIFWSATVAVVANASSGLAVDMSEDNTINTIVNGNLYYFSWAGFVTSILLVVSYLRSVFGVDLYGEFKNRAARLTLWAGLLSCQLVVMGASANILDTSCNGYSKTYDPTSSYCQRTRFGVAVGAIGTFIALGIVAMKMLTAIAPLVVEGTLSFFLCILNGFGVGFLTSPEGPGSVIGNLYYFAWLSWFSSFMLIANIWEDYQGDGTTTESEENGVDGDIPIETIDNDVEDVY